MRLANRKAMSLIELMIALAIVGILAIAAFTIFSSHALRGRRIDGINALFSIALAEERYRSNNTQYGDLTQVWGGVTTSQEGYYSLSISNTSATGYTATATAQGNQANDTGCTSLVLTFSNGTMSKTPATCWPK